MPRIVTFLHFSWRERLLVGEATLWLGVSRLAVRVVPFRRLAPRLGACTAAPSGAALGEAAPSPAKAALAREVGLAVTRAARNVPWQAVCLPQAMAAKAMLARRGIGSTLHFGAAVSAATGKLEAHAWLKVGELVVVGGATKDRFSELASFT